MEIPVQWRADASFLMNQRTAGLLLTMSDALNRPLLQSVQGLHDGPRWSLLGFPIYIASQFLDVAPGSTPIAFGDWRRTYTSVTRKNLTIQVDPYSAGFCVLYKGAARVGGGTTSSNNARLLRIR
jgi:HK97 family phage major capsid protein